jgi:hypothetical protein
MTSWLDRQNWSVGLHIGGWRWEPERVNNRRCGSWRPIRRKSPGHRFYVFARLSAVLEAHDLDSYVEDLCGGFYAPLLGQPRIAPWRYFPLLPVGYFEGLDTQRGDARHREARHGECYQALLTGLAQASGIDTPTCEDLPRLDRKRKKKTSNTGWTHPGNPEAKVAKMKYGRTHLAHKAEPAVDLETDAVGLRSYIAEPDRGRRDWSRAPEAQAPVYGNRRRIRGVRGRHLMRRRGELIERSFAHLYDTGCTRRTHLRGHTNILKRLLIHAGGFNLGLLLRALLGVGTPRGLLDRGGRAGLVSDLSHLAREQLTVRILSWWSIRASRHSNRLSSPTPFVAIDITTYATG